jgi:dienelactone hydrolase
MVYDFDNVQVLSGERALEPARMVEGYRSGVAYLDSRGLADPARIGAIGWSRTSYYVKYALTHSPRIFAAAVVSDGVDYGYGQYLLSVDHVEPAFSRQYLVTYGAAPWKSWQAWDAEAPGFNLQNVQAAVRIEASSGISSVLGEWEFYAGMRRRGLPVDLIVYPDGDHPLVRPNQRMISAEGTLDWLDYWLNGHVDPTDAKKLQYGRWDQMRKSRCTDFSPPAFGEAGRGAVANGQTACD